MKYLVTLLGLAALMLIVFFVDIPFKSAILAGLIVLILGVQVAWQYSVTTRTFTGEVVVRKQQRSISLSSVLLAVFWSFLAYVGKSESDVYLAAFMWAFVIADVISYFVYRQKKPIALAIQGDELKINDLWVIERNLTDLTQVNLNEKKNTLELSFKDKPRSKIKISEYDEIDVYFFAEYLIQTAKRPLDVSENLKRKLTYYK